VAQTEGHTDAALLLSQRKGGILPVGNLNGGAVKQKMDVLQCTLALMILKTLDVLGPLHGYGIARRIEQISGDLLAVNQGTLYPVLLKREQEGRDSIGMGCLRGQPQGALLSAHTGRTQAVEVETQDWEQTTAIIGRFFELKAEDLS
jgi:PadR family transcriptional regulator, regulatory protein PadR